MKIAISLALVLFTHLLSAQANVIKGRALGISEIFTLGLGYERVFNNQVSVQLLFNNFGYNFNDTDGAAENTRALVPEFRYYFGKKSKITLNKSSYVGLFTELTSTKVTAGGEQDEDKRYHGGQKSGIQPGALIGRNIQISKRWYLESYVGLKYRWIKETKNYTLLQLTEFSEVLYRRKPGVRLGVNLGYRF